jgi:hypothetical protein
MWCDRPSGCSDLFVWEKVCFGDSGDWKVWQVPVNLAKDALRMVSLEELQDASGCWRSKRIITHINGKGGDCWNIANYVAAIVKEDGCHCQRRWLPCKSQRGLLVRYLQPLDIVKERGYNGGLLVAANNHCLMSKFGKFGSHHCWQRSKRSCHWSL